MDQNAKKVLMKKIDRTLEKLIKNNMKAYYVETKEEILPLLDEIVKDDEQVSVGGSMSLFESGVIDYLRKRNVEFLDRYEEGLTKDEIGDINKFSNDSPAAITTCRSLIERAIINTGSV